MNFYSDISAAPHHHHLSLEMITELPTIVEGNWTELLSYLRAKCETKTVKQCHLKEGVYQWLPLLCLHTKLLPPLFHSHTPPQVPTVRCHNEAPQG